VPKNVGSEVDLRRRFVSKLPIPHPLVGRLQVPDVAWRIEQGGAGAVALEAGPKRSEPRRVAREGDGERLVLGR